MNRQPKPLLILVAGPYRSGTGDDPKKIEANLRAMVEASLAVYHKGHLPVTGEALALPLIELAGSKTIGDAIFNEIFHPFAHRLLGRIDGVLRIGGASQGADDMVREGEAKGLVIYRHLEEIPDLTTATRG